MSIIVEYGLQTLNSLHTNLGMLWLSRQLSQWPNSFSSLDQ